MHHGHRARGGAGVQAAERKRTGGIGGDNRVRARRKQLHRGRVPAEAEVHGGAHDVEAPRHLVCHLALGESEQLRLVGERHLAERPAARVGEREHLGGALEELRAPLDEGDGRRLAHDDIGSQRREFCRQAIVDGDETARVEQDAAVTIEHVEVAGCLSIAREQVSGARAGGRGHLDEELVGRAGQPDRPALHIDDLDRAAANRASRRRERPAIGPAHSDLDRVGVVRVRQRPDVEAQVQAAGGGNVERGEEPVVGQAPAHEADGKPQVHALLAVDLAV